MSEAYTSFDTVFESYYSRFSAGRFAPGDVIKIDRAKMIKSDIFKSLNSEVKDHLINMADMSAKGDAVIMVNSISASALDTYEVAEPSTITIGFSQGGGRISDLITVSGSLGEFFTIVRNGVNQVSTIPANAVKNFDDTNKVSVKPVDLKKMDKEYKKGTTGNIDKQVMLKK